jgi:polysaccharide biosynthesis/export protein
VKVKQTVIIRIITKLMFIPYILSLVLFFGGNALSQEENAGNPEVTGDPEVIGMYIINSLDELSIVVYAGEKQIDTYREFVKSDGTIYLPFLEKDIKVGGRRVLEAEGEIESLARAYIKEPRIVITVLRSHSQSVSTYGKITNRIVELNTPLRILQLIARVGGVQEDALADSIRVISIDGSIKFFNYEKVNKNPAHEENFFLEPGDIVFVPSDEDFSVMVLGDVKNAGTYSMKRGGKVLEALLKAGSWGLDADIKNVRVLRIGTRRGRVEVKEIDIKKVFNNGEIRLNYALEEGDIIFVPTKKASVYVQSITSLMTIIYTVLMSYTIMYPINWTEK